MPDRLMLPETRLQPDIKDDIQGFITSGFGHLPHGAFLFLEIHEIGRAQRWLKALQPQITTSVSWRTDPDAPKVRPDRTLNIAFTHAGLAAFGLPDAGLRSFPPEFRDGMASPERSEILGDTGDSAPRQWELGGPDNPVIHVLLILNAPTREDLDAACVELRQAIHATRGGVVEHERIAQVGARPQDGAEPFGFFDGVAQPRLQGIKGEGLHTGEIILGYENEYGFFPVSPVAPAADDPKRILPPSANPYHQEAGYRDLGFNGSFVVYRKLAQDVAGFWRFLQAESVRLTGAVNPKFMVWLAAKMVGRWPSGAPLVLAPDTDRPELQTDEFQYSAADPNGLACPFGAHIRRSNPRDQVGAAGPTQSLHMSARHRIMRRGKPYGPPLFDPAALINPDDPEALQAIVDLRDDGRPRGLHFLCANANIRSQFEFIQQAWMNNPSFSGLVHNRDPLAGANDPASAPGVMLVPGPVATIHTSSLPRFVTVRGGAYFFMPSLTALSYLAEPRSS